MGRYPTVSDGEHGLQGHCDVYTVGEGICGGYPGWYRGDLVFRLFVSWMSSIIAS